MTATVIPHATGRGRPLSSHTRDAVVEAGLDPDDLVRVIDRAAAEDLGEAGDVTSAATVAVDAAVSARYRVREAGTIAGLPVLAAAVDRCLGPTASLRVMAHDGDRLGAGDVIAEIDGPARGVLCIERLSLNLLGHLSGIATATSSWVDAVASTTAKIRDTRKTTPGLRDLEKYAVRCGGGVNHRRGLDDAVLIKDNHVAAAGGVGAALDRVRAVYPDTGSMLIQVEVDDLAQLDEALDHGARQVLLDNFTEADLVEAVALVRHRAPGVWLEASGGLRLDRAAQVARTGVDFLAVGALTHSAPSLDIGLDVEAAGVLPLTRQPGRGSSRRDVLNGRG
jgi:nicotinate-nucleotide pyrophosphorylase (carboxylating)